MSLSQALLPEFDQEMANTRKTLERVPENKFGWKPHDKSGTMAWLAGTPAKPGQGVAPGNDGNDDDGQHDDPMYKVKLSHCLLPLQLRLGDETGRRSVTGPL